MACNKGSEPPLHGSGSSLLTTGLRATGFRPLVARSVDSFVDPYEKQGTTLNDRQKRYP